MDPSIISFVKVLKDLTKPLTEIFTNIFNAKKYKTDNEQLKIELEKVQSWEKKQMGINLLKLMAAHLSTNQILNQNIIFVQVVTS